MASTKRYLSPDQRYVAYIDKLAPSRREMLARAVHRDHNGVVTLSLAARDWDLISGRERFARLLNDAVANSIDSGATGVGLLCRCIDAIDCIEPSCAPIRDVLHDVLVFAMKDADYARRGRHGRDFAAGWRQVGTVDAEQAYIWLGDPEESPTTRPRPKAVRAFPPVDFETHARGVAVTISGGWCRLFPVEGLFPAEQDGQMTSIRVRFW